jgi:hypothetical protein
MKGVLFLGLVGVAIYMALVVSHDHLSGEKTEDSLTRQALSSPPARQLRSWGTDLPALARRASPSLPHPLASTEASDSNPDQRPGSFARADKMPTSPQSITTA